MPFEIREIVLQAQLAETADAPAKQAGGDDCATTEVINDTMRSEMRRMIKEELDRRARR